MKRTLVQEIRFEQDYRTLKAVQRDRLRQIAAAHRWQRGAGAHHDRT
jgi:hypothetical protein